MTECLKKTFDWKDIYHEIQQHTQPAECAVLFTEMKAMCLLCIRDDTATASSTQINDINIECCGARVCVRKISLVFAANFVCVYVKPEKPTTKSKIRQKASSLYTKEV